MSYVPKSIQQPRHPMALGDYYLHPSFNHNTHLQQWIESLGFFQYESERYQLGRYSRKRNQLYLINLPFLDDQLVMKVSAISPKYGFWRRVNLAITSWLKDYNLNAFYASIGFEHNHIDCLRCIAQWRHQSSTQGKKSYLLYYYIDTDFTVADLIKLWPKNHSQRDQLIDSIGHRIGNIIHQIHHANMRHGDPHAGNFLIPGLTQEQAIRLTPQSIEQLKLVLIDLDKSEFSRCRSSIIKRFFDLRCLRRLRIDEKIGVDALVYYCRNSADKSTRRIVAFWQRGGFNPYKQLRRKRVH